MEVFATYTFGQGLLTLLEFALLFLWIAMAVTVVVDIFRSHDLSAWATSGWRYGRRHAGAPSRGRTSRSSARIGLESR